ncbi:MAG: peptidylprolyl isomerase [Saprospiraceae bacterium]|nr:peptidylprolyl isomerase [Bacteroidia bacterium]NNE14818.1 peptidylprolyl isomerase [Saprospiraceae bacterium]NNL90623.1 peptidylprolyl isomerase [Saprospiraceae bacterium]
MRNKLQYSIALSLIISVLNLGALSAQENLMIDKVIAKVGTQNILLSDIESQYAYALEQGASPSPEAKCGILESLVGQKIVVHQAKLDSIEIPQEQIETSLDFRINSVLRQMNGDEALFEEFYNMTVNEMRDNLRDDLEQQMLAERMQAEILNTVNITPKEIKEFFNAIPSDSIPYLSASVEISEIVAKPEVSEEERIKALKQIVDIRKRIVEEGESFGELAKKYSDDPGSGSKGGDLGFAERGIYVPEFEAAAFSLEENEISEPIESVHGYHIIKMIERRGNQINVKHILVKPNINESDRMLAKEKLDSLRVEIMEGKYTFSEAVKKFSLEDVPSYHNNGKIMNPNTNKPLFETGELPSEIYFAIEEMEVGDLSEPLAYPLPTGETYYRLIRLDHKIKPHKASLEQDYAKIQQFAKESKKSAYFSSWLAEKISETFIEVDKDYFNCPNLEELISGDRI